MFADDAPDKVVSGTELIAIGTRDISPDFLIKGKTYTALYGAEQGIFPNRPFVTVIGENSKPYSCHLGRFKIKEVLNEPLQNI